MKDLLPGAQDELAVLNGHRERRPEHGGLQMRMAVSVVPSALMAVIAAGRKQLVQHRRQVLLEAGLELDGADGAGAADIEDVHEAAANARLTHDASDLAREIVHLAVAGGLDLYLSLVSHAWFLPGTGPTGQPSLNPVPVCDMERHNTDGRNRVPCRPLISP